METKHTQEPWAFESARLHGDMVKQPEFCLRIYADDPGPDRDFTVAFVRDVDPEIREANARRIVACVNACAGISDNELMHGPVIALNKFSYVVNEREELAAARRADALQLKATVAMQAQRDELAAALRDLLDVVVDSTNRGNGRAAANARAALAKLQS